MIEHYPKHSYYYNDIYDGMNCNRVMHELTPEGWNTIQQTYCYGLDTWRAKHRLNRVLKVNQAKPHIGWQIQQYYRDNILSQRPFITGSVA